jgi:PAS domain S-box-containing protein
VGPFAARAYLAIGVGAIILYPFTGGVPLVYGLFGLIAAGAIVAGVIVHRPVERVGWLALAASQCLLGVADLIYFRVYDGSPPFPSLADAFYLGGGLLAVAGLVLLASRAVIGRDWLSYVDAGVLTLAFGLFMWAVFFGSGPRGGTAFANAVAIAYPAVLLTVLGTLLRVFFVRGGRTLSYYALAGSVLALVAAQAWYVVPALSDRYVPGSWRDSGWLGAYVLAGFAGLHPSMKTFVRPRPAMLPVRRVIVLGFSLVLVALAEIIDYAIAGQVDVYVFSTVALVMAVLVVVRMAGVVRDLEQTRRVAEASERRFRMVFERAPIGISVGRGGIMSDTNPTLQEMLGYTREEFARMHYTEVTDRDDRNLSVQSELDNGSRDAFSIDKRYVRKDGTVVETHVHVALDIEDGFGISLIEDVTARRQLEEQLRQSQKMEAIGKLAGGIAHDFNNLMTAVIGYSDLLDRELEAGDPRHERVGAIRDSARRAGDLTQQLLAFGRRQLLQAADVDLRAVVERMDSLIRNLIGAHVVLETVFAPEPVVVRVDPVQLEQVVMNLAVNARDAMPDGGPLTISVAADEGVAVLRVTDTGVGIEPDLLPHIFEPFFTTKPVGEGTGLGLSTVHGIVGQSGGTVRVESAPGHGASFVVRLPLAPEAGALPTGDGGATLGADKLLTDESIKDHREQPA